MNLPAVSTSRIHSAVLAADHEVVDVPRHEGEGSHIDGLRLGVLQLHTVL